MAFITIKARIYELSINHHLGQRVLKNDTATTIFIYDLMSNMIGEYNPDGTMIADYVYLGSHRLAKIQPAPGGGGGGIGCQSMQQSLQSGGELNQTLRNSWGLMLIMPVLIALGVRHRKNKFVVFGLAIIGAGASPGIELGFGLG